MNGSSVLDNSSDFLHDLLQIKQGLTQLCFVILGVEGNGTFIDPMLTYYYMNNASKKDNVWGVVPFYYDKREADAELQLEFLKQTVEGLKTLGISNIVVIDDGSQMDIAVLDLDCEVIVHDENLGKSEAVRDGLRYIKENAPKNSDYVVVQCDYDADQKAEDAERLLSRLREGEEKQMIIGDRYAEAQPNPPEYTWIRCVNCSCIAYSKL